MVILCGALRFILQAACCEWSGFADRVLLVEQFLRIARCERNAFKQQEKQQERKQERPYSCRQPYGLVGSIMFSDFVNKGICCLPLLFSKVAAHNKQ